MALQDAGSIKVLAVWSHLSVTSKTDDLKALAVFEKASQIASELGFNGIRHLASSPPAFNLPETRFDLVRIGVSAFGTSPIEGKTAEQVGLEIPMTATTTVVGGSEIGVGYLNGYPKNLAGKAIVKLTGKKFKVIAVNELTSTIETGDYLIGDEVVIFDSELTAEYLAEVSDTVTDEIFTALKPNSRTYS
jgi:alanine racemase